MMTRHTYAFEKNVNTGEWRAKCSCGWWWVGKSDEVLSRAATHDLDWQPVEAPQPETAGATK